MTPMVVMCCRLLKGQKTTQKKAKKIVESGLQQLYFNHKLFYCSSLSAQENVQLDVDKTVKDLLDKGDYQGAAAAYGFSKEEIDELVFNSDSNFDGYLQDHERRNLLLRLALKMAVKTSQKGKEKLPENESKSEEAVDSKVMMGVVVGVLCVLVVMAIMMRRPPKSHAIHTTKTRDEIRNAWANRVQQTIAQEGPNTRKREQKPTAVTNKGDDVRPALERLQKGARLRSSGGVAQQKKTIGAVEETPPKPTCHITEDSVEPEKGDFLLVEAEQPGETNQQLSDCASPSNKECNNGSDVISPKNNPTEIAVPSVESVGSNKRSIVDERKRAKVEQSHIPTKDKTKEEICIEVLSYLLNVKLEIKTSSNKFSLPDLNTLTVELKELPLTEEDDVEGKMSALFSRRLLRVFVDKVKYCAECYQRSLDHGFDGTHPKMLCLELQNLTSAAVLKQLIDGIGTDDEDDDLYTRVSSGEHSIGYKFLSLLNGYNESGLIIPVAMLQRILRQAAHSEQSSAAICGLFDIVAKRMADVKRYDEFLLSESNTLYALECLVQQKEFGMVLTKAFKRDNDDSSSCLGSFFEQKGTFASLLKLSTIPVHRSNTPLRLNVAACQPYLELRGFPNSPLEEVRAVESRIQAAFHRIQHIVYMAIHSLLKADREAALTWLAGVVVKNETREIVTQPLDTQIVCSDGYMISLCAVLLKLCEPFCKDNTKLDKILPAYASSEHCRLNFDEDCLAGSRIVSDVSANHSPALSSEAQGTFNFITECFHITQRALHVGVLPVTSRMNEIQKGLLGAKEAHQGGAQDQEIQKQLVLVTLLFDCCLVDKELVYQISQFYIRQASWYLKLISDCSDNQSAEATRKQQRKLFSTLPEFPVRDMCIWFRFVVTHCLPVHPTVIKALDVASFVECCVTFLRRSDLATGPITACKIVSALLHFVVSGKQKNSKFGNDLVLSDLAAMVHMNVSVQQYLGPVLLELYSRVNVVEGQDIDRDEFDKYSVRQEMGELLQSLWMHHECQSSVLKMSSTKPFQDFLGAVLDTLLYQYHDSLARLANVRKTQDLMAHEEEWNKLSAKEKTDQERFLRGEERVAKGFMSATRKTLGLLEMMSQNEAVAVEFTKQPLAQRAASSILGFLEALCGRKNAEFKVKNMTKYNFNPEELLSTIIHLILRITEQESEQNCAFTNSMARDADFNPDTVNKSYEVIQRKRLGNEDMREEWSSLLIKLLDLHSASATSSSTDGAGEASAWLEVLQSIKVDSSTLQQEYINQMEEFKYTSAELQEDHYYRNKTEAGMDPRSPKVKALMKEAKMIGENLPLHPDAAIFVVQDEDHMDLVRAVITGPTDTPYSLGCFAFDIYFPDQYPNVPPLVQFITTGGKLVRFNPNLYADGKVCLSLLGTWHGSSAAEKWNAKTSTLYQVLVSIQGMILISEPMFNEPGYEGRKDMADAKEESEKYNYPLWLHNVRHAMLGQLKNPPTGCHDIIRRHFRIQRNAVLKQCSDWLARCQDTDIRRRLLHEVKELRSILLSLEETACCE